MKAGCNTFTCSSIKTSSFYISANDTDLEHSREITWPCSGQIWKVTQNHRVQNDRNRRKSLSSAGPTI